MTEDSPQAYLDRMIAARGYVLNYHKVMASVDYDVLKAANHLVEQVYLNDRLLDRRTKELLFVLSLTVSGGGKEHIKGHIEVALKLGVSPQEILEAIEIALPEAGVIAFQRGLEAWQEVVEPHVLEPAPGESAS